MGYLSDAYEKHVAENPTPDTEGGAEVEAIRKCCIKEFLAFSRNKLKENPPVGVFPSPTGAGIGLKLTDYTEVTVVPDNSPTPEGNQWMPITRPQTNPLQRGVEPTPTIPITGGDQK